ncbi:predicted protein [Pyrenophora tritici-repentis Pt-1C-BFP]|uniref:Uncharacterized protein n=1 Tax=Pyrenophora tritici-repentis (strain Pt-1C-BFP) TaxID=426418 RepID=B2VZ64_PYRTR|nr:uncharacterized protein PTRG_02704 [Pyrenophora tritici-repentis Pt-1C-BFP]EDU45227.1 predicted protein [Pyrenophora tritici-repentis Pt-1C-BFP]
MILNNPQFLIRYGRHDNSDVGELASIASVRRMFLVLKTSLHRVVLTDNLLSKSNKHSNISITKALGATKRFSDSFQTHTYPLPPHSLPTGRPHDVALACLPGPHDILIKVGAASYCHTDYVLAPG